MKEPGWITKAEAAALLDVDERTVERRARAGRIGARARPGFPTLYRQADVELLRQTSPGEVQTGILEAVPPASSNGSGAALSLQSRSPSFEELLVEVLQALRGALTHGPTGPTGPTHGPTGPTLFLTIPEASTVSGLSRTYLRRAIACGSIQAVKDGRTWRIRRKDLEQL